MKPSDWIEQREKQLWDNHVAQMTGIGMADHAFNPQSFTEIKHQAILDYLDEQPVLTKSNEAIMD